MKKILTLIFLVTISYSQCYSQNTGTVDSITKKHERTQPTDDDIDKAMTKIEAEPQIEAGTWSKFLKKHINYDIGLFNDAPRGVYKVRVKFTVFTDGHVGDGIALTNCGYGMENEVVRALKKSPTWTPATQNGKTVNAIRIQAVTFAVEVL